MILKRPSELSLDEAMHYSELSDGVVNLCDDIGSFSARDVIRDIEYAMVLSESPITLYINSDGGGIYDAIAIHDFIVATRRDRRIEGVVRGRAASAASMVVLQATSPRVATPYSRLHLHEPSKWTHGPEKVSAIRDDAEELGRLHSIVIGILASTTQQHEQVIREYLDRREVWMSAYDAKVWGLIDEIRIH